LFLFFSSLLIVASEKSKPPPASRLRVNDMGVPGVPGVAGVMGVAVIGVAGGALVGHSARAKETIHKIRLVLCAASGLRVNGRNQ
jgi:hypothetical protein